MRIHEPRHVFPGAGALALALLVPAALVPAALVPALLVPATSVEAQEGFVHRIGPRDQIEVRIEELPGIDRDFEVATDGSIELPHAGTIRAEGKTERELADEIRGRLETTGLRRATVSVRITRFSRPVAVLGAVAHPGNLTIPGRASLLDVLLEAGGLTDDRGSSILVRRRASNGLSDQIEVAVEDLFELGDPVVDVPIFAGDVVRVPKVPSLEISFLGEFRTTGVQSFRSRERVTLLVAIARAGGLTDEASGKVRILRRRNGEQIEIEANYRRILNGKDPDPELEDGDILVVRESFF